MAVASLPLSLSPSEWLAKATRPETTGGDWVRLKHMRHDQGKPYAEPQDGWQDSAKCAGQPDLWDLDKDGRYGHRIGRYVQVLAAKLCEGCPVIRDCAVDGMDPLAVSVVRGGVYLPMKISGRSRLAMLAEVAAREAVTQ